MLCVVYFFFFFKQKTAYEMRISDWSSDVCSSDLLYGHLDKQPEMTGWDDDLGPWKPVLRGDRLYGRGGADDGYAIYGSLAAIQALQDQGAPHARCVVLIEACEESGSYALPAYVDHLADRIGKPSLAVRLDSGCGNYARSDERRVGQECVSTFRYRWWPE